MAQRPPNIAPPHTASLTAIRAATRARGAGARPVPPAIAARASGTRPSVVALEASAPATARPTAALHPAAGASRNLTTAHRTTIDSAAAHASRVAREPCASTVGEKHQSAWVVEADAGAEAERGPPQEQTGQDRGDDRGEAYGEEQAPELGAAPRPGDGLYGFPSSSAERARSPRR